MKKQILYIAVLLTTFASCNREADFSVAEKDDVPVGITVRTRSVTPNDPAASDENAINELLYSVGELTNTGVVGNNMDAQPHRKEFIKDLQTKQRITLPLKWNELTRFGFLNIYANLDKMEKRKVGLARAETTALQEFYSMEHKGNYNTLDGVVQEIPGDYYQPPFLMLYSAVSPYGSAGIFTDEEVSHLRTGDKQLEMVRMVAKIELEVSSATGTTGSYQITGAELRNTPTEFYPYFSYCATELPWMFYTAGKFPYYGASEGTPTLMPDIYTNVYSKSEKQTVRNLATEVASSVAPLAVPADGVAPAKKIFYMLPMHTRPNLNANGAAPFMTAATTLHLTLRQTSSGKTKTADLRLDGANTYVSHGKEYTTRGILPNYIYKIVVKVTDGEMGDPISVEFSYKAIPWDAYVVDVPAFS